ATDNCSDVTVTYSDVSTQDADGAAGTCDDYEYVITRTWTAVDACGNSSSCVQIVTVEDTEPPVISCPTNVTLESGSDTDPSTTPRHLGSVARQVGPWNEVQILTLQAPHSL